MKQKQESLLKTTLRRHRVSVAALARDLGNLPLRTLYDWIDRPQLVMPAYRAEFDRVLGQQGISLVEVWGAHPVMMTRRRRVAVNDRESEVEQAPPVRPRPRLKLVKADENQAGETRPHVNVEELMLSSKETLTPKELQHFNLERDPYDDDLSPDKVWMGLRQKWVESEILNTVRYHKVLVLAGEVGSGKTTLVRRLLARAQDDRRIKVIIPATLDRANMSQGALPAAIIRAFEPAARVPAALDDRFERASVLLQQACNDNIHPVLLIDEAHELNMDAFIACKRLWDTASLYRLLGIILVGQGCSLLAKGTPAAASGLERRLQDVKIREFFQRGKLITLDPMDQEEIAGYIGHRFRLVGSDAANIWDMSAYTALANYPALAHPLTLGNTTVRAMRLAYFETAAKVTAEHVNQACVKR